jgi:hypothetical protein
LPGKNPSRVQSKVERDPFLAQADILSVGSPELLRFIECNFIPLNTMMERAGMSETDIDNRTRDIFLYFKLPYDAPPPEG